MSPPRFVSSDEDDEDISLQLLEQRQRASEAAAAGLAAAATASSLASLMPRTAEANIQQNRIRLHHQETSATAKKRTHFEPVVAPKPLSDQAIRIFLARTHPTLFEKQAVERCPKKLYPRLLATALMSPTPPTPPRDFVVRVLLRHWPVASVSVDDLSAAHPPFAAAAAAVSRRHRGGRPAGTPPPAADIEQEWAMDNVLVCLMENFLATLGYAHHRNRMKVLDLRSLPWSDSQHDLALCILKKNQSLITDWALMDKRAHLKMALDLRSIDGSVAAFWREFLPRSPSFVRPHSVVVDSPLESGETETMRVIMRYMDKSELRSLTVVGERFFNQGGLYETDVDHLRDIFNGLYKQELPKWQPRLSLFKCLLELDLSVPTEAPPGEVGPEGFVIRSAVERTAKRPSPCALNNWIQVFPLLPATLRHCHLRGNLLQDHIERLFAKVPFSLQTLNVEDCGLSVQDLTFLARSKHTASLNSISLGDFDLGQKFDIIGLLLKTIRRLQSVNICLEGFDRYDDAEDETLDDSQAMELVFILRQHHARWLRRADLRGGHRWSKPMVFKALKHLIPIPSLRWLGLPVAGLSEESVSRWCQFKSCSGGAAFRYKLERCGPEFQEVRAAAEHYREQRRPHDSLTSSLGRHGIVVQLAPTEEPYYEPFYTMTVPMAFIEADAQAKREAREAGRVTPEAPQGTRRPKDPLYLPPLNLEPIDLPMLGLEEMAQMANGQQLPKQQQQLLMQQQLLLKQQQALLHQQQLQQHGHHQQHQRRHGQQNVQQKVQHYQQHHDQHRAKQVQQTQQQYLQQQQKHQYHQQLQQQHATQYGAKGQHLQLQKQQQGQKPQLHRQHQQQLQKEQLQMQQQHRQQHQSQKQGQHLHQQQQGVQAVQQQQRQRPQTLHPK